MTTDRIEALRSRLDGVDTELVRLIARRFDLVGEIGRAKERSASTIQDAERERRGFQGVEHPTGHLAAQKFVAGRGLEAHLVGHPTFRAAVAALLADEA